ncbi:MAG: hypothetical protein O7F71_11320 [Gammaproteobacteria bacterium]|nr:hypothetical protein [Gammaproteobacteria bacterium]
MTKLSLTILVAALLVSAPVLVSGKEKAFYTVTVPPGYTASVHREDNAYYQPPLPREAYIKRQIDGTQSTFNPKEFTFPKSVVWQQRQGLDSDHDGNATGVPVSVTVGESSVDSNLLVNKLRGAIKLSESVPLIRDVKSMNDELDNMVGGYISHLRVARDAEGGYAPGELFDGQYFTTKSTHSLGTRTVCDWRFFAGWPCKWESDERSTGSVPQPGRDSFYQVSFERGTESTSKFHRTYTPVPKNPTGNEHSKGQATRMSLVVTIDQNDEL